LAVRGGRIDPWRETSRISTSNEIEQRLMRATKAAPLPWVEFLETRGSTGGGSMIRVEGTPDIDHEMYLGVSLGDKRWSSPHVELDAVLDFIAHAPEDLSALLDEVRRLRQQRG
jgi:hypothetical protein